MTTAAQIDLMIRAQDKASNTLSNISRQGSILSKTMQTVSRSVQNLSSPMTGSLKRIAEQASGFIAANLAMNAFSRVTGAVQNSVIGMNASLEKSTLQFKTLFKDADLAKEHVQGLFKFAAETPFETGPIIEASRMLETFGGAILNTTESLRMVGDAAAGTTASINEVAFWTGRAYATIQSGKPFGEAAMRMQELGILTAEGRNKMEALQKSGASAQVVWAELKKEFGRFTGAMKDQAQTWEGVTSTIMDNINLVSSKAMKPFFDLMKGGLTQVSTLLQTPMFETFANNMASNLEMLGVIFMAFWPGIQAAAQNAFTFLTNLWNEHQGTIQGVVNKIGEIVGTLARILGIALSGDIEYAAVQIRDAIGKWAHEFVAWVGPILEDLKNELHRITLAMIRWTLDTGLPTAKNVGKTLGGGLVNAMGEAFKEMDPILQTSIVGIVAYAGAMRIMQTAMATFAAVARIVGPILLVIAGTAQVLSIAMGAGGLAGVLKIVGGAMMGLPLVLGIVGVAVGLLTTAWINNWFDIQKHTANAVQSVGGFLNEAGVMLRTFAKVGKEAWGNLMSFLGQVVEETRKRVVNSITNLAKAFGRILDTIGTGLVAFGNEHLGVWRDIANGIGSIVSGALGWVADRFRDLFTALGAAQIEMGVMSSELNAAANGFEGFRLGVQGATTQMNIALPAISGIGHAAEAIGAALAGAEAEIRAADAAASALSANLAAETEHWNQNTEAIKENINPLIASLALVEEAKKKHEAYQRSLADESVNLGENDAKARRMAEALKKLNEQAEQAKKGGGKGGGADAAKKALDEIQKAATLDAMAMQINEFLASLALMDDQQLETLEKILRKRDAELQIEKILAGSNEELQKQIDTLRDVIQAKLQVLGITKQLRDEEKAIAEGPMRKRIEALRAIASEYDVLIGKVKEELAIFEAENELPLKKQIEAINVELAKMEFNTLPMRQQINALSMDIFAVEDSLRRASEPIRQIGLQIRTVDYELSKVKAQLDAINERYRRQTEEIEKQIRLNNPAKNFANARSLLELDKMRIPLEMQLRRVERGGDKERIDSIRAELDNIKFQQEQIRSGEELSRINAQLTNLPLEERLEILRRQQEQETASIKDQQRTLELRKRGLQDQAEAAQLTLEPLRMQLENLQSQRDFLQKGLEIQGLQRQQHEFSREQLQRQLTLIQMKKKPMEEQIELLAKQKEAAEKAAVELEREMSIGAKRALIEQYITNEMQEQLRTAQRTTLEMLQQRLLAGKKAGLDPNLLGIPSEVRGIGNIITLPGPGGTRESYRVGDDGLLMPISLARGGVTTSETLAHLHPNEAVIPLDRAGIGSGITLNYHQNAPVYTTTDFEQAIQEALLVLERRGVLKVRRD